MKDCTNLYPPPQKQTQKRQTALNRKYVGNDPIKTLTPIGFSRMAQKPNRLKDKRIKIIQPRNDFALLLRVDLHKCVGMFL